MRILILLIILQIVSFTASQVNVCSGRCPRNSRCNSVGRCYCKRYFTWSNGSCIADRSAVFSGTGLAVSSTDCGNHNCIGKARCNRFERPNFEDASHNHENRDRNRNLERYYYACNCPQGLTTYITGRYKGCTLPRAVLSNEDRCRLCHPQFAVCVQRRYCRCNRGYVGSGETCTRIHVETCSPRCHPTLARCIFSDSERRYNCRCNRGYRGNGINCISRTCSPRCHPINGRCAYSSVTGRYGCWCNRGFTGDGVTCVINPDDPTCQQRCHRTLATCMYNPFYRQHRCQCVGGYIGNGIICNPITTTVAPTCQQRCHPTLATCIYNPTTRQYRCQCIAGYTGNGVTCSLPTNAAPIVVPRCRNVCHRDADCVQVNGQGVCRCKQNFRGDGVSLCSRINNQCLNCHSHATCRQIQRVFSCVCNENYIGDGVNYCTAVIAG
uniref:stabilin-2-like isoform X2 n=1 Tax=Ciona intestinalis TaxID=7719 RepID=UPI00089DAB93|nr:stabilin-2-like isoform X2 [Ciona intestinalis]|eukprot:XP_018669498.1 stabilin-2-like isoform X2 [Ciona intestinalis]